MFIVHSQLFGVSVAIFSFGGGGGETNRQNPLQRVNYIQGGQGEVLCVVILMGPFISHFSYQPPVSTLAIHPFGFSDSRK